MSRGFVIAIVVGLHVGLISLLAMNRPTLLQGADAPTTVVVEVSLDQKPRDWEPVNAEPSLPTPQVSAVLRIPDVLIDETAPVMSELPPAMPPAPLEGASPSGNSGIVILQKVMPVYPRSSVRAVEEGATVVRVRVDERGRISEVAVGHSSGFERLDRAAVEAVRKWKFAPAMKGGQPAAAWGEAELRFNLYRLTFSRIVESPADHPLEELVKSGRPDVALPGSEAALRRFMDELRSLRARKESSEDARLALERLKAAVAEWGAVQKVEYRGRFGADEWRTYEVKPEYRKSSQSENVEVQWEMYEVRHDRGLSLWRVAVDRNGTLWSASAGAAPWRAAGR